ncbi:MAG: vWA domain-containing protein [Persicimonas sp.]
MNIRGFNKKSAVAALAMATVVGCMSDSSEKKFAEADDAVESHVRFGGPSEEAAESQGAAAAPEAPTGRTRTAAEAEPAPARKSVAAREAPANIGAEGAAIKQPADSAPVTDTDTEHYADYGVNQMTETAEDRLSTFAVDVDTGSYTIARRKLNSNQLPQASAVRVEEFVNYFRYSYPDPDEGAFGVFMEAAPSPFVGEDNRKVVRVGVQGKRVTDSTRKPVHLTFLVDTSGSMGGQDRIELAKKSLQVLTENLKDGDTVAISTYSGSVSKVLDPTGMEHRSRIIDAIHSLSAGGSTAMGNGLELAYKLALEDFRKDHVNRVVVLSDGDANVGPTSHQEILKRVGHFVDEGVTLSTIGFGMGNYKDAMMEQLANQGNGNYFYIDSIDEARKIFSEQLDGTMQVIAKDVKIQVDFEPEAVKSYRLIGYENRDIADEDFRDDKVDAGEIGAGHTVTALYEVVLADGEPNRLGTVRVRHKEPQGAKASEQEFALTRGDLRESLREASKDFQFAAAVAGFAEIMRDSPYAKGMSLDLIEELAEGATIRGQQDRREFIDLVKKAKALGKG